ncbi:MAG: hypothetical protein AAF581_03120 [Planctomycetota bacterium]
MDREARRTFAIALRKFFARLTTQNQFEEVAYAVSWQDPAVQYMLNCVWTLYSDGRPERLDRQVCDAWRPEVARWVLFLHSDLEYSWPPGNNFRCPLIDWPLNLLTLGWWERRERERVAAWERSGDVNVWPFLSSDELAAAAKDHPFAAGSS